MSRPIPLLIVSTTLDCGGAERFASTLLANIDRDRLQPELVLFRNKLGYAMPADVSLHTLGHRRVWNTARTVARLRQLIRRQQPAIILSNIAATNVVTGMALCGIHARPRWVARVGNSPRLHDSFLKSWGANIVYPMADRIVGNSVGLTDELRTRFSPLAQRMTTLPNPTDLKALALQSTCADSLRPRMEGPLLIAVGRLCQQKRYDLMLEAFARVRSQVSAELWICGDGPLRRQLERQIRHLKLTSSVRLLGLRRNPHALMKQADLFLMSSDHEGSPNALIEAQVLGIPAVTTKCPHGPEEIVIHRTTGFLTPVGNADAFANAVLRALKTKELLSHTSAYEQVRRRFDANRVVRQWEDLLCQQVMTTRSEPSDFHSVSQVQSP
ncbi:N-acetylgalactosamine-N,N'-diacetylbacillosaminyl-diphospho-undecaprenol 4-alpha-N-acetylgalactosaminyltransferase [Rosistilla ulvae]|uniref:N-acetylgalactosamine-N, N'-diacetylbacillosaminyl-diphospho-undecaprenol 4-alpha-N-acetylgalactosaminyltransferase n=1 Tax=Rosistilla ulvae TaxID=1930277 RepID=A0A517M824_9BACT|nr:glycosyltransferase [Rosistilla ulvae]QDS91036.1 N-acetylgalactosamine-N,N'-diacetylbacillosaminyl-diphospho-undecaprenol 4-alpha-N-acetylgalactosaminyltransferase [Rosistilla ulvae]